MLIIRPQQYDTFEQTALLQFEDEMVAHLREFTPKHAEGVGEDCLRQVIRLGVERAKKYEFTLRGPVRFYIELMIMFGSDFDTDPLLPWASSELRTVGGDEMARADRLHEVMMAYRDKVVGPKYEVECAAIRRLLKDPVNVWLAGDHSDSVLEVRMRSVYPEKCNQVETVALRSVISRARRVAEAETLPRKTGGAVLSASMLAFGHGCPTDPQFPWIADNLKETVGQPGEQRVEKLATRLAAYLTNALSILEQG